MHNFYFPVVIKTCLIGVFSHYSLLLIDYLLVYRIDRLIIV